ncbi:hypothetical protein ABZY06_33870 [Streptomyces sp. NPDC006540]|uniref:hypothetical protein n=1 Tax=Streptomyces sp. NPDC006540 TaxID=3155353 RepID=UPI0033B8BD61
MPKRGVRQPFRLSFEWRSGIKGTHACYDLGEAEAKRDELFANAEMRDSSVTVTILNRDTNEVFGPFVSPEDSAMTVTAAAPKVSATLGLAGKMAHPLTSPGSVQSLCGKVVSKFLKDDEAKDYPRCTACGELASKESGTVATKTATEPKPAQLKADVLDILAGLENISDAAKAESMINSAMEKASAIKSAQMRIPLVKKIEAAADKAKASQAPAKRVVEGTVVADIAGKDEIIAAGITKIHEAVELGRKMGDKAMDLARIQLGARLRAERKGLPDLEGQSGPVKALMAEMYTKARNGVPLTDVTTLEAHESLKKAVSNRMQDVTVEFLRSLDADKLREHFPLLTIPTNIESPEAFIRAEYKEVGITLPEMTRAERAKLDRAKDKAELPAATDASTDAPSSAVSPAVQEVKHASELADKLAARIQAKKYDEKEREALKAEVQEALTKFSLVFAALA